MRKSQELYQAAVDALAAFGITHVRQEKPKRGHPRIVWKFDGVTYRHPMPNSPGGSTDRGRLNLVAQVRRRMRAAGAKQERHP